MKFTVGQSNEVEITDDELYALLSLVYVGGNYTDEQRAMMVFNPQAVRNRGTLFVAKEEKGGKPVGMVIVVPPDSPARVLAGENECEVHLLAVNPQYRGYGLGKSLVSKAIAFATKNEYKKMILWTQLNMTTAQNLYNSFGFVRTSEMSKGGIAFLVYERECA